MKILYIILSLILSSHVTAQTAKFQCTEKEKKNPDSEDPILIKTCLYKNFKFVITSNPDYAGRYNSKHEVFTRLKGKFIKISNEKVFNVNQKELVQLINEKIIQDFKQLKSDSNTKDCLTEIDSIPTYKMNDFKISFEGSNIWFMVNWGLSSACRAVDGTIVTFSLSEIAKYLK